MNNNKLDTILELTKKENFYEIDESTVDKLINIIKSGRIPKDDKIVEILLKLDEGGLL